MRIRVRSSISVTDGRVVCIDPGYVFPPIDVEPYVVIPPNVPFFDNFGGDGSFSVYQSAECVVVDTAPRQFKPNTRSGFAKLDGAVFVDSGMIAFVDIKELVDVDRYCECSVIVELPPGEYLAWSEENENSSSRRRVILGLGVQPVLFLAGTHGTSINHIETDIAATLKLKGDERQQRIQDIHARILELHWGGCKDRRLKILADAVKLTLPHRRRKRQITK